MTAAMDVLLALVLLAAAVFVLLDVGRDLLRDARARRALVMRRLEDIGILFPIDSPEDEWELNQWRRDRWTAKIAGRWPRKVRL